MRELGTPYQVVDNPDKTKAKIILTSAELFALWGYTKVSIRDIAKEIGILPGSIYAHFPSKEAILEAVLLRYEDELHEFYLLLDSLSVRAKSLSEILNNIFMEVREIATPFSYCALWAAMTTQFEFEVSRHVYYDVFFTEGCDVMKRQLDLAVERRLVEPFHTEEVAPLMTDIVMSVTSFHIGKMHGYYPDMDIPDWCNRQLNSILRLVGCEDECITLK